MKKSIIQQLQTKKVLLSDGAWGTLLQQRGLKPGECPESWNLKHPELVLEVAKSYIEAGSDLIETNSFGASKYKLAHYGLEHYAKEYNFHAAAISRKAAGNQSFVLGSVGPTGVILMMGEVSPDDLYAAFKEQVMALEEGGADAICIETMTDLEEASLAVRAAKEHTQLEVICTMTFDKTMQGDFRTMMGVSPQQMVDTLLPLGVDILGSNCGNGMENMIGIVAEIRKANSEIPLLIHANAGLPKLIDGKNTFSETPEVTASFVPDLMEVGANIIGGCCGTTPDHIQFLKKVIKNRAR